MNQPTKQKADNRKAIALIISILVSLTCFVSILIVYTIPYRNEVCCMYASTRSYGELITFTKVTEDRDEADKVYTFSNQELLNDDWELSFNWALIIIDVFGSGVLGAIVFLGLNWLQTIRSQGTKDKTSL